ncbi:MAG: exodeoxyribonuclease VII large subunit [Pseudomonadota bacterium]
MTAGRRTLTVTQLARQARQLLEDRFALVWVEGEISNLARPGSGHWYFTLKDNGAQLRCAMFAGRNRTVRFPVRNGLKVVLRGRVSLYEARGDFQLIAEALEPAGEGALRAAFEALKATLAEEGLFAETRKRPLPAVPAHIALITSPTGAVIRDFLTVLRRRFPASRVTLLPVPVQGDAAPDAIVTALRRLEVPLGSTPPWTLAVLARGGGSLEDLWAFNTEPVARAIAAAPVPVVSAIGHQTDFTIADFVADLRAPTPSAAAELIAPDRLALLAELGALQQRAQAQLRGRMRLADSHLRRLRAGLISPSSAVAQRMQRCDELVARLQRGWASARQRDQLRLRTLARVVQGQNPQRRIGRLRTQAGTLGARLQQAQQRHQNALGTALAAQIRTLNAVSPLQTLQRGFSLLRNDAGQVVSSIDQAAPGNRLEVLLADGRLDVAVTDIDAQPPLDATP